MVAKLLAISALFRTVGTLESTFVIYGMFPHVGDQMSLLPEPFPARITLIRKFVGMNVHVLLESPLVSEMSGANFTLMEFLTIRRMQQHM